MDLQATITSVLKTAFGAEARPVLETSSTGSVHGIVISDSFSRRTDRDRQQALWSALQRALTAEQMAHITFILATTPEEEQALVDFPLSDD